MNASKGLQLLIVSFPVVRGRGQERYSESTHNELLKRIENLEGQLESQKLDFDERWQKLNAVFADILTFNGSAFVQESTERQGGDGDGHRGRDELHSVPNSRRKN